ncbi:hypothetical protein GCM10009785_02140 [Brooklawnia cerclae]|uniref:Uncharacterized protein n=1 Tax=Brooklawnia cerclae TaxID=349934 RepID=A0ABX0SCS8_9ACTN|nr:hypothetical protein [Brooklawnia cerclae]NIH56192.1 hypothetical protein [Brooklawnia cerclae]
MIALATVPTSSTDRDYLVATLDALRRLEDVGKARGDLDRDLERRTQHRRTLVSALVAAVIPIGIWVFFVAAQVAAARSLTEGLNMLAVRSIGLVGATVLLFLVVYIICNWLWHSTAVTRLRAVVEKPVRADYLRLRDALDVRSEAILAEPVFADPRIPANFIHPHTVALLLRFFDSGQATFLDAALYMLRQEMANTVYYSQIVPAETAADRERERIAVNRREIADHD